MKARALPPAVLCIGGLDPSGGAGLLADAEAVSLAGGRPLAVITAVTVQSRRGVTEVEPLDPALVVAQADQVFRDEAPRALKIGMLGTVAIAHALRRWLAGVVLRAQGTPIPIVIDPVLRSSSGVALFDGEAWLEYPALPATVITPNLLEIEALVGPHPLRLGSTRAARERAARILSATAGASVILKGGHARGHADDLVYQAGAGRATWLPGSACRASAAAPAAASPPPSPPIWPWAKR